MTTEQEIASNRKRYEDEYRALTGAEVNWDDQHPFADLWNWLMLNYPHVCEDDYEGRHVVRGWSPEFERIMSEYHAHCEAEAQTESLFA